MINLKEYLKRACTLEQDVYEKTERIKHTENELLKLGKEVAKKKQELKLRQSVLVGDMNKTLKEQKIANEPPQKSSFNYLFSDTITFFSYIAIAILLYHVILRIGVGYLYPFVFQQAISVNPTIIHLVATLVTNILPSLIIATCCYYFKEYHFGVSYGIAHIILQIYSFYLTFAYVPNLEKIYSIIYIAMAILLLIDVSICTLFCLYINYTENKYIAMQKTEKSARVKELNNILLKQKEKVDNMSKQIAQYEKDSLNEIANVEKKINILKSELTVIKIKLMEHYNQNVIHPKYRNWVAVATIYEYLDTGICRELTGPNGAYKFYEEDLRAQRIAGSVNELRIKAVSACSMQSSLKRKIDDIISKLNRD